ncbi:MAG: FAD-dependent oxidoreductase [Chloroflexi bacterium]|nr:FAD-dependent oxidoreductase [Chloroflexota bacterium]
MRIIIVGNSAAGLSALEAFRKIDQVSCITVVTKESARPYSRVLLPYFLRGKIPFTNLFIRNEGYFDALDAECIEDRAIRVDAESRQLALESGRTLGYDRLLVASGSSPVKPPIPGLEGEGIFHLWSLDDAERLAPYFAQGGKVAIIGAGFISLQAAWAALSRGLEVCVLEVLPRIMPRVLDDQCAQLLHQRMEQMGVEIRVSTVIEGVERASGGRFSLHLKGGDVVSADFIIVGAGVRPNVDFLRGTDIQIKQGILVNDRMETSIPGIYAAGDVAQLPSALGSDLVVHALWPTAVKSGRIAGTNMAGEEAIFNGSLNMNVTQMFEITVASMGDFVKVDGMMTWSDESIPEDQYLSIFLKDGVPVGAVSAGSSELVATLGMLQPLIREKVRVGAQPGKLKTLMAQNLVHHHRAFSG